MISKYTDYIKIYTDGSASDANRGCAIIFNGTEEAHRLPAAYSSFSCEVVAIKIALQWFNHSHHREGINLTDSKPSLEVINNQKIKNCTITERIISEHN